MDKTLESARHKALIAMLIEARKEAGITQTELASMLGEYKSFVARLESGQRYVDVVELLNFADLLNFDEIKLIQNGKVLKCLGLLY